MAVQGYTEICKILLLITVVLLGNSMGTGNYFSDVGMLDPTVLCASGEGFAYAYLFSCFNKDLVTRSYTISI